jgi:hypothetical protein
LNPVARTIDFARHHAGLFGSLWFMTSFQTVDLILFKMTLIAKAFHTSQFQHWLTFKMERKGRGWPRPTC